MGLKGLPFPYGKTPGKAKLSDNFKKRGTAPARPGRNCVNCSGIESWPGKGRKKAGDSRRMEARITVFLQELCITFFLEIPVDAGADCPGDGLAGKCLPKFLKLELLDTDTDSHGSRDRKPVVILIKFHSGSS